MTLADGVGLETVLFKQDHQGWAKLSYKKSHAGLSRRGF